MCYPPNSVCMIPNLHCQGSYFRQLMHHVGAFLRRSIFIAFHMEIIFNFDNYDKLHTCNKITYGSLDFVVDRLGTYTYRTLNPSCRGGAPFHLDVPRKARGCCGRWCTRVGPSHGPPCSVLLHQLWSQTHP